ncbi:hypothetical protein [Vibrio coralliilyticus]|uniref:hypothetical protein n=1 Tax=Vibrio coralliilyticus TaxID=190893 RepID=UPI0015CABF8E|nr:hypothetical protein [Vibrio coralliilyticus]
MSTLQAIPTQLGIDILNSELKNTVTKYRLIGALTHDASSESLYSLYENTIETSYYDDNGVLTFILNLPIEQHFDEYLHQIHVLDNSNQSVIECSTPKVALPKGIGGMVTLKAAISGEAGQVIFKHSDYLTTIEFEDKKATQAHAETGTDDQFWITSLKLHQAFNQFGLGKGVVFSGDDFHLLTKPGQFRIHTDSSTKNVPFGLKDYWFDVIVTGAVNDRYGMIAVSYGLTNEPRIFHKSNANRVWSDWVELSHSGNLKLPIYPEVKTDGNVVGLNLIGTELTVYNNPVYFYGWQLHRINPTGIKFTVDLSKTYHLRFSIQSGLKLKDVTDATYNPSSKAETDASFDSTYDDMLLAKIESGTLTPLINKPELYAETQMTGTNTNPVHPARLFTYNWARTPIQSEGLVIGINAHSLSGLEDWNYSARESVTGFDVLLVNLNRYTVHHKYRALDNNSSWTGGQLGVRFKQEVRA